jgi:hypothetical protein
MSLINLVNLIISSTTNKIKKNNDSMQINIIEIYLHNILKTFQ